MNLSSKPARDRAWFAAVIVAVAAATTMVVFLLVGYHLGPVTAVTFFLPYSQYVMLERYSPAFTPLGNVVYWMAAYAVLASLVGLATSNTHFGTNRPWLSAVLGWACIESGLFGLAYFLLRTGRIVIE